MGSDIEGEAPNDCSGFVSLSSDGNVLAIGGPYNDGTGSEAGHVRVFEWSGGSWSPRGSDIDGAGAGDYSGYRLALSGDGAVLAIGSNAAGGHVNVYQWSDDAWAPMTVDSSPAKHTYFGVAPIGPTSNTGFVSGWEITQNGNNIIDGSFDSTGMPSATTMPVLHIKGQSTYAGLLVTPLAGLLHIGLTINNHYSMWRQLVMSMIRN